MTTDLDLSNAEDRAIYRLRVAREFQNMKLSAVKDEMNKLRGSVFLPRMTCQSRVEATNMIANMRLRKMGF